MGRSSTRIGRASDFFTRSKTITLKNVFLTAILLGLFGFVFFGCEAPFTDSPEDLEVELRAQPVTVESTEFTETLYNPCTDEEVELSGVFHTVTRFSIDANGVPHWGSATHFGNTSGIGKSSGRKYLLVGLGTDCENPPACLGERTVSLRCNPSVCPTGEGVFVFTGVLRARLVAQGAASDAVITQFFHATWNSAKEMPVVVKSEPFTVECS